jgi:hypothetical protein
LFFLQIIQGNIESDDMAIKGINDNKEYKIPFGLDDYNIDDGKNFFQTMLVK